MTGLLLYHEAAGSKQALVVAVQIADLHVALFSGDPKKLYAQVDGPSSRGRCCHSTLRMIVLDCRPSGFTVF
jgi:hypothetical protein